MGRADIREAENLEADALADPQERWSILLEAADAWDRAGRPDRAITLLRDLAAEPGDERCVVRIRLAGLHLQQGDRQLADAELTAAAKDPGLMMSDCELAAEFLAEHGDLEAAARWYDKAAARLSDDDLEALRRPDQWRAFTAAIMLRGRHGVRRQLGRAPDTLDDLIAQVDTEVLLDQLYEAPPPKPVKAPQRNAPCPCGSGRKYKKCCGSPTQRGDSGG